MVVLTGCADFLRPCDYVIPSFLKSSRGPDPLDTYLRPAREKLLRNLLRSFVIIGGIACSAAVATYIWNGVYALALFYGLFYCAFVILAQYDSASFEFKRLLPIILLLVLLGIEYVYFGSTPFANTLIYSLVVFSGLIYGTRVALVGLSLAFTLIGIRAYQGFYFTQTVQFSTDIEGWFSPLVAQFGLIALTVTAISIMFRQMQYALIDKHQLINDLQQEINDREQAQAALKLSEEQFDQLFQQSKDAVALADVDTGSLLLANNAAETLFDLDQEMLKARPLGELIQLKGSPPGDHLAVDDASDLAAEVIISRADGEERIAEMSSSIVEGGLSFLMFRDITERKKLEEQVAQAQKMEAVGQLAGGIAHDFNNSLQVIIGFCELAKMKIKDGPGSNEIDKVYDSGKRSQKLVAQLLAFSRRQQLATRPIDLNEAAGESLDLIKRLLGDHITLQFDSAEQALPIRGDRNQLEQVLLNLCINARDAINDNGILRISLNETLLTPEFCRQNPWGKPGIYACLTVADNGCGMPDKVREKVFEPFFTTKEAGKGTGLGLSSVLGIVQQHEGFVHLESEASQGTTFTVYIPLLEQKTDLTEQDTR